MSRRRAAGFTLIEVLVALMVVAIGLSALMVTLSSTARTSAALRDKTLAQWIALNRLTELRLSVGTSAGAPPSVNASPATPSAASSALGSGSPSDAAEVRFAGRSWHYDTRYFSTSIASMQRVVVRVYAGDAKTQGAPMAEATGFIGAAIGSVGQSNQDWTTGELPASAASAATAPPQNVLPSNQFAPPAPIAPPPAPGDNPPASE